MKIYVASSWRNEKQQDIVKALREAGFEVYDFKNPKPGDNGFHWSEIDKDWKQWTPEQFRNGLKDPYALAGFGSDMGALKNCDACVLVNPCGRSAHLELGYAVGAGKRTIILLNPGDEPELMYKMVDSICVTVEEVIEALKKTRDAYDVVSDKIASAMEAPTLPGRYGALVRTSLEQAELWLTKVER